MPIGPFDTFEECETAQMRKGKSKESAAKICGFLEHNFEKHNQYHRAWKSLNNGDLVRCPDNDRVLSPSDLVTLHLEIIKDLEEHEVQDSLDETVPGTRLILLDKP